MGKEDKSYSIVPQKYVVFSSVYIQREGCEDIGSFVSF